MERAAAQAARSPEGRAWETSGFRLAGARGRMLGALADDVAPPRLSARSRIYRRGTVIGSGDGWGGSDPGVSMVANARVRSQRLVCMDNLRLVSRAVHVLSEENGKRPRSFSRVMTALPGSVKPLNFLCPADPALRRSHSRACHGILIGVTTPMPRRKPGARPTSANPVGSWSAELAEVKESPSHLHPLGWRRPAWQRQVRAGILGPRSANCMVSGFRPPRRAAFKPYLQYEGEVFRGTDDGTVVKRKVFRPGATAEGRRGPTIRGNSTSM